ncbi:MAG: carboxypeptidase regulatory-like domain-containing protein [Pyrinomonadaceae bacterium]
MTTLPMLKLTLVITTCLAVAVLSSGQDAGVSTTKKPYVRTGYEATLSGTITFTGKRPKTLLIDMSADPPCYDLNPEPTTESVVTNKRHLANVLVYVRSEALNSYKFEPTDSPAMLEHRGCRYVPHVLGMEVGQPLNIFNSDSIIHNTHAVSKNNSDWNQTQPAGTPPLKHTFQEPDLIAFKDNQHPWEKAYVGVFVHPFFAVSDELGNYRIEGLPPGKYTVVAWHEGFGEKTEEITVVPDEARNLRFTFAAK